MKHPNFISTTICDFSDKSKDEQREKLNHLIQQNHQALVIKKCTILKKDDFKTLIEHSPQLFALTLEACAGETTYSLEEGLGILANPNVPLQRLSVRKSKVKLLADINSDGKIQGALSFPCLSHLSVNSCSELMQIHIRAKHLVDLKRADAFRLLFVSTGSQHVIESLESNFYFDLPKNEDEHYNFFQRIKNQPAISIALFVLYNTSTEYFCRYWKNFSPEKQQALALYQSDPTSWPLPLSIVREFDSNTFLTVWNTLTANTRQQLSEKRNKDGTTVAHTAITCLDHAGLRRWFADETMTANDWTQWLLQKDNKQFTVLDRIIMRNLDILGDALSLLPAHAINRWLAESPFDGLSMHESLPERNDNHSNPMISWIPYQENEQEVNKRYVRIDHRADVHKRGSFGDTALHWAAYQNKLERLKALLPSFDSVNVTDNYGETALQDAVMQGHTNCIRWLFEQGAVFPPNAKKSLLTHAIDSLSRKPLVEMKPTLDYLLLQHAIEPTKEDINTLQRVEYNIVIPKNINAPQKQLSALPGTVVL